MELETQVAMILQTMDIIKTMTRSMDRHYIINMVPGQADWDTFDRQTSIIYDKPEIEETVMADDKNGPTPALHRQGMCVGIERGVAGGLVVFFYDEVVDKATAHVYQRQATFKEVTPVGLLEYVSAFDLAASAANLVGQRMAKLRKSADDLNAKWLVLKHISNGSVRDRFVEEANRVISQT